MAKPLDISIFVNEMQEPTDLHHMQAFLLVDPFLLFVLFYIHVFCTLGAGGWMFPPITKSPLPTPPPPPTPCIPTDHCSKATSCIIGTYFSSTEIHT